MDWYKIDASASLDLPFYLERISAGFPSPAQDYLDGAIDLVRQLVPHPSATYVLRVTGDSMRDAAIVEGSLLLVDFSLQPRHGDIGVARRDGGCTVKRLQLWPRPRLWPENPAYAPIPLHEHANVEVIGVVTTVIQTLQNPVQAR
ncbi:MAG TPA: DNA polymerase V subunit UmuD [Franconibacter helveticus]|nr:DNA polymerase V subunit UmuD [Franconibacter helveticus]